MQRIFDCATCCDRGFKFVQTPARKASELYEYRKVPCTCKRGVNYSQISRVPLSLFMRPGAATRRQGH